MSAPTTERRSWSLGDLPPHAQAVAVDLWAEGYAAGIVEGRRQLHEELQADWQRMRELIRPNQPDYATLAERRGQHARAASTRALWVVRGLAGTKAPGHPDVRSGDVCAACQTPVSLRACSCGSLLLTEEAS